MTHKDRILQIISKSGNGYTRNEIAEFFGIRLPTVCSAVHALIKAGKVTEYTERLDRYTEQPAKVLTLPYIVCEFTREAL